MATKAQLEAELVELKQQLSQRDTLPESKNTGQPSEGEEIAPEMETLDWDVQVRDVLEQLEDLPHSKPLLFALGAFALGYLIGRSK